MPPFAFSRITKDWMSHWKYKKYQDKRLTEFLDKIEFKKEVNQLNIRTPKLYYHGPINKCPENIILMKNIIIKRLRGAGQVYQNNSLTPKQIKEKWKDQEVIIEETIRHFKKSDRYPIPFDYKIYVFKGDPKYVLIINRNKNGKKAKKLSETHLLLEAETLKDVTYLMGNEKHHGKVFPIIKNKEDAIPDIKQWNCMLDMARRLGGQIFKDVFVRLDFFIDEKGAVLCELSPSPKGHWFWWFHQARYGSKKDKSVWKEYPDKYRVLDRLCMEYKLNPSWMK